MEFLIKAAQFFLSLSIIVILHEMGHYLTAKQFGMRVERFFLFFDVKFALWKKQIGETLYGVGWLPLGGYVKIAGMVDESMDTEALSKPPQPWEFRAKPAWQRLIVMLGGVIVNLLLGMLIYICVLFTWGREYLPLQGMPYGVEVAEVLEQAGFQDGDIILKVDGKEATTSDKLNKALLIDGASTVTVKRNGDQVDIPISAQLPEQILESGTKSLFEPRVPFIIDTLIADGTAIGTGLLKGDRIYGINEEQDIFAGDVIRLITENKSNTIDVEVDRNGQKKSFKIPVSDKGKIGIGNRSPLEYFDVRKEEYGLMASIPEGIKYGWSTLTNYARSLKLLFSKAGVKQIGGFGTIGGLFGDTWQWQRFWEMTAFISIMLAFMNVLPIPALDGGHAVFIIWEMITGRPANQNVLEYAQLVGFIIIIALVLYANGNDIVKWLG